MAPSIIVMPAAGTVIISYSDIGEVKIPVNIMNSPTNALTETGTDIGYNEKLVLGIIVILIIAGGIYPQAFLSLTEETTKFILNEANIFPSSGK